MDPGQGAECRLVAKREFPDLRLVLLVLLKYALTAPCRGQPASLPGRSGWVRDLKAKNVNMKRADAGVALLGAEYGGRVSSACNGCAGGPSQASGGTRLVQWRDDSKR